MLKKKRGASAHSKDFDSHGHKSNSRGTGSTSFNRYGEVALGNGGEYSDDGAD